MPLLPRSSSRLVVICAALLVLSPGAAGAQPPSTSSVQTPSGPDSAQSVGVKIGVNFSNLTFDEDEATGPATDRRAGFSGGMFLTRHVWRWLAVQGEALMTVKGAEAEQTKIRLTYLEVPLLARASLSTPARTPIHLFTGPALAFKIDASESDALGSRDIGATIANFDAGWVIGGGVDLAEFVFDVRYTWGLLSVPKDAPPESKKVRNESFTIMAGMKIW